MATYVQRIEALTFEIPTKYSDSKTVSGETTYYALLNDIAKEGISDIIDRCTRYAPHYLPLFSSEFGNDTDDLSTGLWDTSNGGYACLELSNLELGSNDTFASGSDTDEAQNKDFGLNLYRVSRNGITCKVGDPVFAHKYTDSDSLYYVSEFDPIYYIEAGKLFIYPGKVTPVSNYFKIRAITPALFKDDFRVTEEIYEASEHVGNNLLPVKFRKALILFLAMDIMRYLNLERRSQIDEGYKEIDTILTKMEAAILNYESELKKADADTLDGTTKLTSSVKSELDKARQILSSSDQYNALSDDVSKSAAAWLEDEDTDMASATTGLASAHTAQASAIASLQSFFQTQGQAYNTISQSYMQMVQSVSQEIQQKVTANEKLMADYTLLKTDYLQTFIDADIPQRGGQQ